MQNKRIEWVNIFKAIAIISVVIGHSTGKYNIYIYQFHMAAFFFISGYTTNLKARSFLRTVWTKFLTMILPVVSTFFVGVIILSIANKLGLYSFLFKDPFIGLQTAIKAFLINGDNYVIWMGATWFIIVLFEIVIVHKFIYDICGANYKFSYCISSILLLIVGYYCVNNGYIPQIGMFPIDLMLIGQFYFFLGQIFKHYNILEMKFNDSKFNIIYLVITIIIMYFSKGQTVDYPSRHFQSIIINVFSAVNGIIFLYLISFYLTKLHKIKNLLIYIGNNTMGIVLFHFMFFNIAYAILIMVKVVPFSYLKNFTPTTEIGNVYWPLISFIAITFSIILWRVLLKSNTMAFILGQKKYSYNEFYEKILEKNKTLRYIDLFDIRNNKTLIKFLERIKKCIYNNKVLCMSLSSITVLIAKPIFMQGIICNDELQARYYRNIGFFDLLKHNFYNEIRMGRPMRALAALNATLGFTSNNIYIYRTTQIIVLLISIILFGYLLYKIFDQKEFAIFTTIMIGLFLPITFEHSVPNAFNGLVAIPMIFLIISLILYCKYIERNNKKILVLSMVLFFIAMLGYEFIVTFCVLFPLLYIAKIPKKERSVRILLNKSILPCGLGGIFIILMLGTQKIVGSQYEGAQIGFVSFTSSAHIIWMLLKTSLPGYYLFNSKYQYLFNIYSGSNVALLEGNINQIMSSGASFLEKIELLVKDTLALFTYNLSNVRIAVLLILVFIVLFMLFKKSSKQNKSTILFPIVIGIVYMILPSLPNSVSKLYQGNITPDNFTGLPVTYFLFVSSMFTICYIIWNLLKKIKNKKIIIIIITLICVYSIPLQGMNEAFSTEQNYNYNRLLSIEKLFNTNTVKNMNNQSIYAPDLYNQKNLLYVHDGYWEKYSDLIGLKLKISKEKQYSNENFTIFYQNDNYFVLNGGNEIVILSEKRLSGVYPIKISNQQYISCDMKNETLDSGLYCYKFIKKVDENNNIQLVPNDDEAFKNMKSDAGSTLSTACIIQGYYSDGWVSKNVEFKIKTGQEGKVILSGYYPEQITGKENSVIYINNEKILDYTISQENFNIELKSEPNTVITLKIENNFKLQNKGNDIRELSFILSDAEGK